MPKTWRKSLAVMTYLGGIIMLALSLTAVSRAQSTAQARLYPLEKEQFPIIRAYLDVFTADGSFWHGLTASQVTINENNQTLPATELTELRPGVQFALAITYGPALGIRDGLGNSRYDYLLQGVLGWTWAQNADAPDDLSLILDGGPETLHVTDPAELIETLQSFQLDARQAIPSLQPLSRAIQVVQDAPPRPGMDKVVLFITPPQGADAIIGLQSLAAQASQAGIRVYVWQVSIPEEAATSQAEQIQTLTSLSGGGFFNYTGSEAIPDIETYLEPLRYIYQLAYQSQITASGSYPISITWQDNDLGLVSTEQTLEIALLPPNVVFVGLPSSIERTRPEQEMDTEPETVPEESKELQPSSQALEVLVEFPDGYPRQISSSTLIVDGVISTSNLTEPFDQFTWDLSSYTTSATHTLQVVITDTLGLSGSSTAMPVEVIIPGSTGFVATLTGYGVWIAGLGLLFLAALIVLGLVISGRLRPHIPLKSRAILPRRTNRSTPTTAAAPTNPNAVTVPRSTSWMNRLHRSSRQASKTAAAYLIPFAESDAATKESPIALGEEEIIMGRDPQLTTLVLNDPALAPVHARLRLEDSAYRLTDAGTIAGTWVNYRAVPAEGVILRHGDIVHLGQTGFQFTSRNPKDIRKAVIITPEQKP
jgi:hypothetical protein